MNAELIEMNGNKKLKMNDAGRTFKLDLLINKNEEGCITDIVLKAQPQGEAEFFCITFVKAVYSHKGGITLTKDGIVFSNGECPFQPAEKFFPLNKDDRDKLHSFLNAENAVVQDMRPKEIGIKILHLQ